MHEKISALISRKSACVLATVSENRPHCSLMAYIPAADARTVFLVSSRSTRKYHNILRNKHVSLLIDTRDESDGPAGEWTKALTVTGHCRPMADGPDKEAVREQFRQRHPELKKLLEHPDSDILEVRPDSFLFLDGVMESYFEKAD
jgi:nitroimidazol reductase NimA-like FMN-containing flavoprotein (pyridoxamine 5'-phosphate oxidase superfamily)